MIIMRVLTYIQDGRFFLGLVKGESNTVVSFSKLGLEYASMEEFIVNYSETMKAENEKKVSKEDVKDYVFGYTILNDISARDLQVSHKQWYFGKSLDNFTPIGPWIVTADEIAYPPALNIRSKINGELRQNSNTNMLITSIDDVIFELTKGMTLDAGTIIAMGTPSGVGLGFVPPKFLKPGDVVECEIESIGVLSNTIGE